MKFKLNHLYNVILGSAFIGITSSITVFAADKKEESFKEATMNATFVGDITHIIKTELKKVDSLPDLKERQTKLSLLLDAIENKELDLAVSTYNQYIRSYYNKENHYSDSFTISMIAHVYQVHGDLGYSVRIADLKKKGKFQASEALNVKWEHAQQVTSLESFKELENKFDFSEQLRLRMKLALDTYTEEIRSYRAD